MLANDHKSLIKETLAQLQNAQGELNRPSNDVVSISVCNTSRESMKAMMRVYLLSHGVNVQSKKSIREFLNHCIEVDKEFSGIDMSCIGCQELDQKACEGKYCMAYNDVDACLTVANKIKTVVLNKMNIKDTD